jgi:L-iditol 2-dehydrogenase
METMRAIVQLGERSVEVQQRTPPEPGPQEVRVAVQAAGICGSDAHAYSYDEGYEWVDFPRIMGHEYAGIVDAVGEGVEQFTIGDHVIEEPVYNCGECFQCKNGQSNVCQDFSVKGLHTDGAYADYTVARANRLHRVPDKIPFEVAAITEPASVAIRAVVQRSDLSPGDRVLVEGPGPIGALTAVIAESIGANVAVSGLAQDAAVRLPILDRLGLTTVNVSDTPLSALSQDMTGGVGFDIVFDTTGHRTGVEEAANVVRKGGEIVVIGLPSRSSDLSITNLVRGEVNLLTSYGSMWRDFERAIRIMQNGDVDFEAIIDTGCTLESPKKAFESFLDAEFCKPVFTFNSD